MISCLMSTYAREEYIHESVACYLEQDYLGPTELIILNDLKEQKYVYNGYLSENKKIKIINLDERFPDLGAKRDALHRLAEGNFLCYWDDDDISFSHRLSLSIKRIKDNIWSPSCIWVSYGRKGIRLEHNPRTGAAIFLKAITENIYAGLKSPETAMFSRAKKNKKIFTNDDYYFIKPSEAFYIYRLNHSGWNIHNKKWDDIPKYIKYTSGVLEIKPKLSHEFDEAIKSELKLYE